MRRVDEDPNEKWVKAGLYGPPGSGKTDFGVSAPKPLILLSERQGLRSIKAAAARRGVPVPTVLAMDNLQDYRDVLRALHGPKDQPFRIVTGRGEVAHEGEWPETVVLDSLTDACELVEAEVRKESPPEKAKDGLERWTERHWSALRDRCERLIRSFRDAPVHVLFLALQDDRTVGEGEEAARQVGPSLPMRALPGVLAASVNVVGITSRAFRDRGEDGQREIAYEIRTVGPSFYLLKPFRPLLDLETSDFASWVQRIASAESPQTKEPKKSEKAEKKTEKKDEVAR
jgi:hypothetical protein